MPSISQPPQLQLGACRREQLPQPGLPCSQGTPGLQDTHCRLRHALLQHSPAPRLPQGVCAPALQASNAQAALAEESYGGTGVLFAG